MAAFNASTRMTEGDEQSAANAYRTDVACRVLLILLKRGFVPHAFLGEIRRSVNEHDHVAENHGEANEGRLGPLGSTLVYPVHSNLRNWTSVTRQLLLDPELAAARANDGDGGHAVTAICRMSNESASLRRLLEVLENPLFDPRAVRPAALCSALRQGHVKVVQTLLRHPKSRGAYDPTPVLQLSPYMKHLTRYSHYMKTPFVNFGLHSPLTIACSFPDPVAACAMAHHLLDIPFFEATAYYDPPIGFSPLKIACKSNLVSVVAALLRIPSVCCILQLEQSFKLAIENGHAAVIKLLMIHGMSPFFSDVFSESYIQIALHTSDASRAIARSFVMDDASSSFHFLSTMVPRKIIGVLRDFIAYATEHADASMLPCIRTLLAHRVWDILHEDLITSCDAADLDKDGSLDPFYITAAINILLPLIRQETQNKMCPAIVEMLMASSAFVSLLCSPPSCHAMLMFLARNSVAKTAIAPVSSVAVAVAALPQPGHGAALNQQVEQLQQAAHAEYLHAVRLKRSSLLVVSQPDILKLYTWFLHNEVAIKREVLNDAEVARSTCFKQFADANADALAASIARAAEIDDWIKKRDSAGTGKGSGAAAVAARKVKSEARANLIRLQKEAAASISTAAQSAIAEAAAKATCEKNVAVALASLLKVESEQTAVLSLSAQAATATANAVSADNGAGVAGSKRKRVHESSVVDDSAMSKADVIDLISDDENEM